MRWLLRLVAWIRSDGDDWHVSTDWLAAQQRMEPRNRFHGRCLTWPLEKSDLIGDWRAGAIGREGETR